MWQNPGDCRRSYSLNSPKKSQTLLDTHLRQIGVGLALLGMLVGFLVGFGTLSGDQQGRVNLLFLLLILAFLPVMTLVLSLVFLLRRNGRGLAGWLLELPLWPRHLSAALLELDVRQCRKDWLVHQGQVLGLSFSFGTLFVFLLLLLGTDISFVWRSTILEAADLLPTLQLISFPWRWWPEAQPSLLLLEQTRDFRLSNSALAMPDASQWWRFILAVQVCYSLLPRSLLWLFARQRVRSQYSASDLQQASIVAAAPAVQAAPELAEVVQVVSQPWTLLVWGANQKDCIKAIQSVYGQAGQVIELEATSKSLAVEHSVVVLVKSWEPPLAELADVLQLLPQQGQCLILPVEWSNQALGEVRPVHFAEWRRFAATLPGWKVLQREGS